MRNIFTGIIEELGVVKSIAINGASGCITIKAKKVLEGTQLGDSIAVNGTCLTVTSINSDGFSADGYGRDSETNQFVTGWKR